MFRPAVSGSERLASMPRTSLPDACQRFTQTYGGTASSTDRTRARGRQGTPQDRGRLLSRMCTSERRPAYGGIAPKPAGGPAKPWARVCLLLAETDSTRPNPSADLNDQVNRLTASVNRETREPTLKRHQPPRSWRHEAAARTIPLLPAAGPAWAGARRRANIGGDEREHLEWHARLLDSVADRRRLSEELWSSCARQQELRDGGRGDRESQALAVFRRANGLDRAFGDSDETHSDPFDGR